MKNMRVLTLLCAILMATPAFAQTVKVNWNQAAPFSDYKTYAWKTGSSQANSIYSSWVKPDVDAQLAAKGLTQASGNQKPDIYVTFHLQTQEVLDSVTTDDGLDPAGVGAAARGEPGEVGVAGADGAALLTQTRQSPPRNLERWE